MNQPAQSPAPSNSAPKAIEIADSERASPLLTIDCIGRERKRALLVSILTDAIAEAAAVRVSEAGAPTYSDPVAVFAPGTDLRRRADSFMALVQCKPEANCPWDLTVAAFSGLLSRTVQAGWEQGEAARTQACREASELRTVLDAWQAQFGSTQLSHAIAKQEAIVRALEAELGPLREIVGVRADAASSRDDITNWVKLVDRSDRVVVIEAANRGLRACLANFTNPERWLNKEPGLQWFGKRNPIEYAETVLKETDIPSLADTTSSTSFVVEGLDVAGRWVRWGVTDDSGREANPCSTLEAAQKIQRELDEYRTSEKTGWRGSRISIETVVHQVVQGSVK